MAYLVSPRRQFLIKLLAGAVTTMTALLVGKRSLQAAETVASADSSSQPALVDMRQRRYAFVVDVNKCIGCGNCVEACTKENFVPEGDYRTWVERYTVTQAGGIHIDSPKGAINGFPPLDAEITEQTRWTAFIPKLCNHCQNAPCVQVCPVGATFHAPGGFVLVDPGHCIGCGYCIQACPYGARFFNRETQMADKCTWCYHRIVKGLQPACVTVCPTGARAFGDLNDTNTLVAKVFHEDKWQELKPAMHTKSACFYLGLPRQVV